MIPEPKKRRRWKLIAAAAATAALTAAGLAPEAAQFLAQLIHLF